MVDAMVSPGPVSPLKDLHVGLNDSAPFDGRCSRDELEVSRTVLGIGLRLQSRLPFQYFDELPVFDAGLPHCVTATDPNKDRPRFSLRIENPYRLPIVTVALILPLGQFGLGSLGL